MPEELKEKLRADGYYQFREIEGRGLCGLMRFIFTVGLCHGLEEHGYAGRYCYDNESDAKEALELWSGEGDPEDEFWIKHKGLPGEWSNPKKEI